MKYVLVITMHADPAMAPGYDEWGGTNIYMKELMDGLGAKKIKCIMVTRKSMPLQDIEQYNEYCTIYRLHNGNAKLMDKTHLQYYHEGNRKKIQSIIDKHGKPEVIHSVYWNSGRLAMELAESNCVSFVHSVISNSRGRVSRGAIEPVIQRAEYEQQIYNRAAYILCVSEDERQDLINFYGINPSKICVAGQYINESFLLPAHDANGFPRLNCNVEVHIQEQIALVYNNAYKINTKELYWNQKVFTYVGRMSFYKGVNYIIIAWYRLYNIYDDQCPALWMVGGSIYEISKIREEVKKQIQDLDFIEEKGKLVWWGYLDPAGISTILLKSLVLVTHSQYEPGGRVVVEAMLEGIPVIATPNGFAKDYIQNWVNGFLVKYADMDGLLLRLEHFVRQPFLSSALGQSARKDAKKIVKKWNFIDNHLMAYGLTTNKNTIINEEITYNYFKMRNIHLFPYYNIPLSEKYIRQLFEKITKQSIVEFHLGMDSEHTSHIFRVKGSQDTLIFKQKFTRLSISPLYNPFGRKDYVREAGRHFRVELATYKRSDSKILVGYDSEHQLLLLKELVPPQNIDLDFLQLCIQYIISKKDTATASELDIFDRIMQDNMDSYDNIIAIYNRLEQELPNYYFEKSGCFYERLGWSMAPYILKYNHKSISKKFRQRLIQICDYFASISFQNIRQELRCINIDTELKHFMFLKGDIKMFDYEKCAIGCVENEVASLLYDYLLKELQSTDTVMIKDILKFVPLNLSMQKIIISMAYRCFYDIQIQTVMHCKPPNRRKEWLEYLYSISANNE